MRILICDDEPIITEQLKQYLQEYFTLKKYQMPELVIYFDGKSLLADTGRKDILFLDIEMPGPKGIEIGRTLKETAPNTIIFVITSHMQYLDDAMRFHVYRYLSKPLEKKRLFANMDDAVKSYHTLTSTVIIENKDTRTQILESDIIYIEAQLRTTLVHTVSGEYLAEKTIHSWIDTLNPGAFFQTHKSYIVNMKYVVQFNHGTISFSAGKDTAYLSRRKYNPFIQAYYTYLESSR